ncbi:hypothetical protein [Nocardia brasiliensis]|uniref:hypothetical protein n=1 Tax=Nocardia brasiliensis TaxID=37326 RepID=UPI00189342C6|nr:hypothetical protein [Nocardia brasiliensis]MBF6548849.1 hypothetical protein [Nocardia brasiliensis]
MFGANLSGIAAASWIIALAVLSLISFLAITAVLSRDPRRQSAAERVLALLLLRHKDTASSAEQEQLAPARREIPGQENQ